MNNIIFSPQPKQAMFMSRPEFEALFGGSAGAGKSFCMLIEALRQAKDRNYQGLIMRKTYPQLMELINTSLELYPKIFPGAKYNDSKHVWKFPSGGKIYFGSLHNKKDKLNFQGHQYQFIGFDELTHFQLDEYMFLVSRCRPRAEGQRCYVRCTANPGGPGHGWVKDRFISLEPFKRHWFPLSVNGETLLRDRIYIPATIFDNKKLLENDPNYIATLAMLPEAERKALLYGDWDSFNGQVFAEWKNDSSHYIDREWTHVINEFKIPDSWKIYRVFDFGYAKPFSVGWYAQDHDGRLYRIREYYGCTGTPNEGLKIEPVKIAQGIKEIEEKYYKGRRINGIADPSIWDRSRGESIAEMMERVGVYFEKADNARIAGKMQIHYRLGFDEKGIPMLYVFNTCKHFIRTMPNLVYDILDVEDVDTKQEDHIYDECRYMCMSDPIKPRIPRETIIKPYDPLSTDENKFDPYAFMRM